METKKTLQIILIHHEIEVQMYVKSDNHNALLPPSTTSMLW